MAFANPVGISKQRILDCLAVGPASINDLSEKVGVTKPNIGKHLADLKRDLRVDRRFDGKGWIWFLPDQQAQVLEPKPEPESGPAPIESERVKLVEELLEIERVLSEQYPLMLARRTEILEMLK